ncbi:hypothetical protein QUF76_19325 [Desulfobacterales bacterium HSG16]|nr:hypothetical protein [Desulfobacterales bacterium HSG16]
MNFSHGGNILNEENKFKRTCRQVMLDGVNNAKMTKEIQINFLVQAAVVKMLIFEIRQQYDHLLIRMKELLREYEIARDVKGAMELKSRLGNVQENRSTILSNMGKDLFELLIDVQKKDLKKMREINFGEKVILPDYVFSNPLFHVENFHDDGFMIDEYDILIGRRIEIRTSTRY